MSAVWEVASTQICMSLLITNSTLSNLAIATLLKEGRLAGEPDERIDFQDGL
jgi:hypothetical protein